MKSAVIINLDYERHSALVCRRVWDQVVQGMEAAGFNRHFRLFLADMDRETACNRAKKVVSDIEDRMAPEGIIVFDLIREFYWFEYQQINDLLAPSHDMPEVSYIDTGAFRAFLNTGTN